MKNVFLLFVGATFLFLKASAQLTSTNLPIVLLTTSATINDTVQVQASMKIVDNASGLNHPTDAPKFDGMVGLRYRGNTSYPKKSLSVETWSSPTISLDTSLLNMPSENDWVLLASYEDRSMARFLLSSKTVQGMGRYAPRLRYCELMLNGNYQGIYLFGEKIKRDSNRVDLAKLTNIDVSGDNLTGGYICVLDGGSTGWTSAYAPPLGTAAQSIKFQMEYPDPADILPVQLNYIHAYVDSFENAMNASNYQDTLLGWRRFAGKNTAMDYMIINEVCKDIDAYRKNAFLNKDKLGKIKFGPIWGHDVAWKNTTDCTAASDTGWAFNYGGTCTTDSRLAPFWWAKLTTDTAFMRELKCTYSQYRKPANPLDTTVLFAALDSVKTYLNAQGAVSRNFTQWPIWGVPIVNEPTPMASDYDTEIANLKTFIKARLAWLDTKWYQANGCPFPDAVQNIIAAQNVSLYPNPAGNQLNISLQTSSKLKAQVNIIDVQGKVVMTVEMKNNLAQLDISNLKPGMYFAKISANDHQVVKRFVKE